MVGISEFTQLIISLELLGKVKITCFQYTISLKLKSFFRFDYQMPDNLSPPSLSYVSHRKVSSFGV